ncbi:MAG TPA: transcription-repair coupling factor, partial [Bacteroidota bacterium]|nr:transcription-repair coupling factor [Bacteroidota bacterium]
KIPQPQKFAGSIFELTSGQDYDFQKLLLRMQDLGFERKEFVESYGDVAVRGGIIDVFPYVGENPIRIEFWGDSIESIREFDVLSQRSIRDLQSTSIVPALSRDPGDLSTLSEIPEATAGEPDASLFDYLGKDSLIILDEPSVIEREINEQTEEASVGIFSAHEILSRARQFPLILNSFVTSAESQIANRKSQICFRSTPQPAFNGSINMLVEVLSKLSGEGYEIHLTSDTTQESIRLKELIEDVITSPDAGGPGFKDDEAMNAVPPNIELRASNIHPEFLSLSPHSGFIFNSAKLALFTEHEIFGRLKRRGLAKRRRFKGFSQKELQQLKPGDYVVHVDHGIGLFDGLKKLKVGGVAQEVMKLLFLENDVLYVNLNFVDRVQKYSSQDGHVPALNKLGGAEWERAKAKAKRRIKDIARDIIALYAKRKLEKGYAFSPDTHWQKELEASFMYEDTEDQAKTTADIKLDMEDTSPMDRLVCGDVGFGKTEVAVRAAFKAVMDGKQVAILVPTTILALQHYNTFQDRLSRYTTRIENITRFKSKKEQHGVVRGLQQGSVDIIIGTHRLLSKDIAFKDLGLLVIDEEHRFGVTAKEKLRKLKASVDTLALTATPIPRTLHFSLIGARDLSLIATPPRNRLPIITELIAADSHGRQIHWEIIREAILRELHRSGQAYFVHDRVHNIDSIAGQVKQHVPEARVHIAHGQMSGHELEKTMLDFLEKKYDVLICTKIIESGLDIPSVNTIIVNRADTFGLAELYQLRGRVGRSNVQAYAYLLTPPISVMPKTTLRRLQAIEEFTELGSGFNLAMRDLEIRGAGNLLGGEQSGFIMEMGFEMYERIVREAVEELKESEFMGIFASNPQSVPRSTRDFRSASTIRNPQSAEAVIESDLEALIPEFYIESDTERLDIYRRVYKAVNVDEFTAMRAELQDRFGEYPEEVENLLQLVELRLAASRAGFPRISINATLMTISLPEESNAQFYGTTDQPDVPFQRLMKKIADRDVTETTVAQSGKQLSLRCKLHPAASVRERLIAAKNKLEEITRAVGIGT